MTSYSSRKMTEPSKVYVTRTFQCSAEVLFDWLTRPELIMQWFGPKNLKVHKAVTSVKVSGSYRFDLGKDNKDLFAITGEYLDIVRPERIVFSYRYEGLSEPPPPSKVRILLKQLNPDVTSMMFTQEFEEPPPDMETRDQAWKLMFEKLEGII